MMMTVYCIVRPTKAKGVIGRCSFLKISPLCIYTGNEWCCNHVVGTNLRGIFLRQKEDNTRQTDGQHMDEHKTRTYMSPAYT